MLRDICQTCTDTIKPGQVYCLTCGEHAHMMHLIDSREAAISAELQTLGWSIAWHGGHDERWAALHRASHRTGGHAHCTLHVRSTGRILRFTATEVTVHQLAALLDDVARSFNDHCSAGGA
jgi:hypothetical protein